MMGSGEILCTQVVLGDKQDLLRMQVVVGQVGLKDRDQGWSRGPLRSAPLSARNTEEYSTGGLVR